MSLPLTFLDTKLIQSALVGPDGAVHYTLTSTHGLMRRKSETTISAASGLTGVIYWTEKTFEINGVQRRWDDIESRVGGLLNREHEWDWAGRPYTLKYQDRHRELLAVPKFAQNSSGVVRFTPYHRRGLRGGDPAVIYFPFEMQDEFERMFLLMAVLKTEVKRQDAQAAVHGAARLGRGT
ncbi:hypothetical protein FB45DRAFT_937003 [Roridomyces roridus]|uniref:Uncharacterized protein n=1 Tax=Roridomyces roridus TaxID=1738132 RepID=A0AAD7B9T8_9AGAR|nr:hypothetical protein FB45DRAFT_937003 [Roridomyces roridus]